MRRSIATVSLSGGLREKLDAIASARFDGVEIFENDLTFFNGSPRDVAHIAGDLGLSIDLFQPFRDFEGVDDAAFLRNLDRIERKFDLMQELGAPLILVCSNVSPAAIGDDQRSTTQLAQLAERAGKRGLRVGFEALSWGTHISTLDHAYKLVEAVDHPHLGLIIDSFHTLALPHDWSGLSGIAGERIFFMQLADAPRLGMNVLPLSRHFRCFPGQGEFPVAEFVTAALEAGYAGPISLEIFNDDMRAAPPRQTARDAMRSLLYLEEQVRGLRGDALADANPGSASSHVELFDPPPAPELAGVAFLEFTIEQASQANMVAQLTALGMVQVGRHKTKSVLLFALDEIRFALNFEPDSFAHAYLNVHGASVCAIALQVADSRAAMGRAVAFGCTKYEGRVGPNELTVPAIRTVDGSLIYFVDSHIRIENDFDMDASALKRSETGPLSRIDHITQALPEGELDSWVLFYRAVFGLSPTETVIMPDPYGLIRSRSLANLSRSIRLPLNISESKRTATARSVSTYFGAGVHHIALETQDIFAAAAALQDAGGRILPISANYYDDLEARFGLSETFVWKLKSLNILYDRVGDAEFFQVYTIPFEGRFFFELVQRKGGYDDYGAANAPARLAALAQYNAGHDYGADLVT